MVDVGGIEPPAFWVQAKRSTTGLHALILVLRPGFEPGLAG